MAQVRMNKSQIEAVVSKATEDIEEVVIEALYALNIQGNIIEWDKAPDDAQLDRVTEKFDQWAEYTAGQIKAAVQEAIRSRNFNQELGD